MSEHLEEHYTLQRSGRWRVDRTSHKGLTLYYRADVENPKRMILEDAYKLELLLAQACAEAFGLKVEG